MPANESLLSETAVELRRRIGSKEISPVELLEACIARIERLNPAVNAVTATCGGASSGNCAIGSVGIAIAPARMITSEHTLARIGRRMKVSTNTGLGNRD